MHSIIKLLHEHDLAQFFHKYYIYGCSENEGNQVMEWNWIARITIEKCNETQEKMKNL